MADSPPTNETTITSCRAAYGIFCKRWRHAARNCFNPDAAVSKGDAEGFSAFFSMPDFLRAKVFNVDTVADHHFIAGLAAAYALQDKIKSQDLADFMVGFIKSFTKQVEDDKAAPDGILKNYPPTNK